METSEKNRNSRNRQSYFGNSRAKGAEEKGKIRNFNQQIRGGYLDYTIKPRYCGALFGLGGEEGSPLEHLQELFRIIREIYKNIKKE